MSRRSLTGMETIGALAKDADGLRHTCRSCQGITCTPFPMILGRVKPDELLGFAAVLLRCSPCGQPVTDLACVSVWRQADDQPRYV